ncbi:H(+)/Cl(-) exchange transporter 7-like isoform X1 [Amphibalanus amphitrite]|uniref:H(+)/Cl(-) exchange transporter 7-like isoform X1 n=1 Tax=Amphibalanus amphitrite TaxID=1232801 RepID=UPI001C911D2C|nr:H(+)/Cl(-) exchange transporter 7-like isoform X1 [Amphibalanus amphitrite]
MDRSRRYEPLDDASQVVADEPPGAAASAALVQDVAVSVNYEPEDEELAGKGWRPRSSSVRRPDPIIHEKQLKAGHYINAEYESLDYEVVHSDMNIRHQLIVSSYGTVSTWFSRTLACAIIGVLTSFCAVALSLAIDHTAEGKFGVIRSYMLDCTGWRCLAVPFSIWLAFNLAFAVIAFLMVYIEPVSIGSGIPQVKCYLNGVKIPRCVRLRTLVAKLIGVYASVMAGLPVGKEGPMIHSGAVIAAGFSQGKSSSLKFTSPFFKNFREDHEKRDFVACGTAAGVCAAFGSPGGGVMFAIEEGASSLHQDLLWRFLFTSFLAFMVLKEALTYIYGQPGHLLFTGLLDFGSFGQARISSLGYEGLAYGLLAAFLGLLGALFVALNVRISLMRRRYLTSWPLRCSEVLLVSAAMVLMALHIIMVSGDANMYGSSINTYIRRCKMTPDVLAMTDMLLQTPEAGLRSLLHAESGTFPLVPVGMLAVYYYVMTLWTYALPVPSGVFIPSLVTGAAFGRFFAVLLIAYLPEQDWVDPGKFALFGAAAMLGGVVRMAISLTFIIVEAAGVISFGPLLMFVFIISKYVADCFNESLYDAHIELDGIPLLSWRPPPQSEHVSITKVMSAPVRVVHPQMTAGDVYDLLDSCTHNGFPVVDPPKPGQKPSAATRPPVEPCQSDCSDDEARVSPARAAETAGRGPLPHYGRYRGLLLRSQLVELLKYKVYDGKTVLYNDDYPRYPSHKEVHLSEGERHMRMSLLPYMNPGCMVIMESANLPRVYAVFRALLLRHVPVVNHYNQVIGIVTRKDLARYRAGGPIWRRSVHRVPVWRPPPPPSVAARLPLRGVCRHTLARRLEARAELRREREGEAGPAPPQEPTFHRRSPAAAGDGDGAEREPIVV